MGDELTVYSVNYYRDGGTIDVKTDEVDYCIDRRIGTKTEGVVYIGYPKNNGTNRVPDQIKIERRLLAGLEKYQKRLEYDMSFTELAIKLLKEAP